MVLCFAMGVLEGFDIQVLGVAAPRMSRSLGLDAAAMTMVFFASNLGLLVGASAGGWLADRRGRRPVLVGAALTFGVFTLATAAVNSLPALLAVRLLAGLGLGSALPNMVAVAAAVSPPARLGRTTAMMFCGVPLGGAAVALVAQGAADIAWRTLFVIGGILPLLLAVAQWRYLHETWPGVAAAARPIRDVLFSGVRWRRTILLWLAVGPTLMALYLALFWLPTLLTQRGFSPAVAAQAAAVFNIAGVAGAVTIGALIDRLGARLVCGVGYLVFAVTAVLLANADHAAVMLSLVGIAGFLILGLNYAVYGLAGACYPDSDKATGAGAALSMGRLGSICGPTLSGMLIVAGIGPGGILRLLAPIALFAGVAVIMLENLRASALGRR